jgi:H+-transporting ATPase
MAAGARMLAEKKAIVSKFSVVEEMSGIDILCSDKSGTLTQNKLTLGETMLLDASDEKDLLSAAALASRAEDDDAIDLTILSNVENSIDLAKFEVSDFQPFDPVHKRTEATVQDIDRQLFKVAKGAPQVILALAANRSKIRPLVEKSINDFASRGLPSVGVARTDEKGEWRFL